LIFENLNFIPLLIEYNLVIDFFTIKMINEISPNQFNNKFSNIKNIADEDYIIYFENDSLLMKNVAHGFEFLQMKDFKSNLNSIQHTFLFSVNHVNCFLIWEKPETNDGAYIYREFNSFRTLKPQEFAWGSIVAFQLMKWYEQNRFCGKCCGKTTEKEEERAIYCPKCNNIIYPKISPAVIVAILCNDKILLAHNANFDGNRYSLVAGYVDIGESLEETVIREVKEEVGIDVKNIRYYKSQPWPFSCSLMIGFIAEADDAQPIYTDNIEITEAKWFSRGNLPNHPPTISIAGEMIEKFERGIL